MRDEGEHYIGHAFTQDDCQLSQTVRSYEALDGALQMMESEKGWCAATVIQLVADAREYVILLLSWQFSGGSILQIVVICQQANKVHEYPFVFH